VVSVDTKKKELIGRFKNTGREWRPSGEPERVKVHDFEDQELGKALSYGIYDIGKDAGWVNVGQDHDTATFAVESLRRWWRQVGQPSYPRARRLLISAGSGGSNGSRLRLWKWELARRKRRQVSPVRRGAGGMWWRRSRLRMLVVETRWPSLSSSPRMRT